MREKVAPITVDHRIARIAAANESVITYEQLRALGLSAAAIGRRRKAGRLHQLYRGVYAVGPIITVKGRWLAAVRACGPYAVLSHRSAAALWDIRPWRSAEVDATVPGRAGRRVQGRIRLHRPTRLTEREVTFHHGIPVTTPARTLLDLAAVLPRRPLERAVDEAERLGLLDECALKRMLAANRGRRGAAALRALLESHAAGTTPTRNDLEELLLKISDDDGLPRPLVNSEVGRYSPDFLWPEHKLIVETDGRASHGTRAAFEHDRARDAWLTAEGYRVVRFTHRQVTEEPAKIARLIAKLLQPAPRSRA